MIKTKIITSVAAMLLLASLAFSAVGTSTARADGVTVDNTLVQTYADPTYLVDGPTVVCDVTDIAVYENMLEAERRPSNAILRFSSDKNVVSESGSVIGSFEEVYRSLNHEIIPIVYISDEQAANAFINFWTEDVKILDMAVMSDNPDLVSIVRSSCTTIRGIVEYKTMPDELYNIIRESTEAQALTVVLPQSGATVQNVLYLQVRFKSVWVRAENCSFADYNQCINSGAYGVISTAYEGVFEAFTAYDGYVRNIFNVAHRGLPQLYNENSLGGTEAAIRAGATHVELDGHLTKDKHIVINHDDTIDRETNGSGNIADLTLEYIKSCDLDLKQPTEKMPTLEEICDLITALNEELERDVVLVFEIKDDQPDFVQYMKEIFDEKDFYENLVIITFDGDERQLDNLKRLVPWIPTANLDGLPENTFASTLVKINEKNTGVDLNTAYFSESYRVKLRDRGYAGWYWTFGSANDVKNASKTGYLGVTNNAGDCFTDNIYYLYGENVYNVTDETSVPQMDGTVVLNAVTYGGEQIVVTGTVYYTERTAKGWRVFAYYTEPVDGYERTTYAQEILYLLPVKEEPSYWWISLVAVGALLVAGGTAATVVYIKRKKSK